MFISKNARLFDTLSLDTHSQQQRFSYFGLDFGTVGGFENYIKGYILASKSLFIHYQSFENYEIEKLDTLVYPLCFIYRHIVELYIKYFFFKYSKSNEQEKKVFIKKVNHKLRSAWDDTRTCIDFLLNKINNPIDLEIIENYVQQFDDFDGGSFRMRYPIKKNLTTAHTGPIKLDIIDLNKKMMTLFELFEQLDSSIDSLLIENICKPGFTNFMKKTYLKRKSDVVSVMDTLRDFPNEKPSGLHDIEFSLDKIIDDIFEPNIEEEHFKNTLTQLPNQSAAVLALLTHVGRNLSEGRFRLAENSNERTKDFFKVLELTLIECAHFISFSDKFTNYEMCYAVLEKSSEVTLNWLKISTNIFDCILSS